MTIIITSALDEYPSLSVILFSISNHVIIIIITIIITVALDEYPFVKTGQPSIYYLNNNE